MLLLCMFTLVFFPKRAALLEDPFMHTSKFSANIIRKIRLLSTPYIARKKVWSVWYDSTTITCPKYVNWSPVNSPHRGQWRGAVDVFFGLRRNKRMSKQSWGWWCETPLGPLWRNCNVCVVGYCAQVDNHSKRYFTGPTGNDITKNIVRKSSPGSMTNLILYTSTHVDKEYPPVMILNHVPMYTTFRSLSISMIIYFSEIFMKH